MGRKLKDQNERSDGCRNEAHKAINMLKRLTAENPDLSGGIRGLAHDMAAKSQEIDEILDAGFVPMVKVPKVKGDRCRNHALGSHKFTTRTGATVLNRRQHIQRLNVDLGTRRPTKEAVGRAAGAQTAPLEEDQETPHREAGRGDPGPPRGA